MRFTLMLDGKGALLLRAMSQSAFVEFTPERSNHSSNNKYSTLWKIVNTKLWRDRAPRPSPMHTAHTQTALTNGSNEREVNNKKTWLETTQSWFGVTRYIVLVGRDFYYVCPRVYSSARLKRSIVQTLDDWKSTIPIRIAHGHWRNSWPTENHRWRRFDVRSS